MALTGLTPNTTYYYRATSVDAALNAGQSDILSFVTASGTLVDTTQSDFGQGTPDANLTLTAEEDGEVRLASTPGSAEFEGTSLPADWTSAPWPSGGTATVTGGALVVDGARAHTTGLSYTPGTQVEFAATFGAVNYQNVGLASGAVVFDGPPAAMFSTDGTQVLARVWTASDGFVDTPLGAALLNFSHVYRIVWKADGVDFWVDDALRHTEPIAIGGTMSVAVSDFVAEPGPSSRSPGCT